MRIESAIAELEDRLTKLRKQLAAGYEVIEVTSAERYILNYDHEAVYENESGSLAGIVVDQKVMTKYFASNPYGKD